MAPRLTFDVDVVDAVDIDDTSSAVCDDTTAAAAVVAVVAAISCSDKLGSLCDGVDKVVVVVDDSFRSDDVGGSFEECRTNLVVW
jgi:hypothetical protein